MIAIDTNIVVRYLTSDHPQQSQRARKLVDEQPVFVSVTVVLETEWVLRSAYKFRLTDIAEALRAFGGLPSVTIEDASLVAEALDQVGQGMDFADSLHFARSSHCDSFATFDQRFITAARAGGYDNVHEP